MISSPLLNIVAESMVILLPIRQVGWLQGIGQRGAFDLLLGVVAKRPAAGGEDHALDLVRRPALHRLEDGRVFGIDRQDRARCARRASGISSEPATTSDSLFASASVLPASHGGKHRRQPRRPDDRRQRPCQCRPLHHLHHAAAPLVDGRRRIRREPAIAGGVGLLAG